MTCPFYPNGADRRGELTPDEVCHRWNLDYNTGKILECIHGAVNSDPSGREELLGEAYGRLGAALEGARRDASAFKAGVTTGDDAGCMMRDAPAHPNGGTPKADAVTGQRPRREADNMPNPRDRLDRLRDMLEEAAEGLDKGDTDLMGAIIGTLGVRPPEDLDAQTIQSMDRMVRDAIDAVSKLKGADQ